MGIKAITTHLNTKGYRFRGKAFYTASVERILKNEAYIGIHYYNRIDSRTRKERPPSEWIKRPCRSSSTRLHLFVSNVVIRKNRIQICGPKYQLLKDISEGENSVRTVVPTFAREWRARRDSNS